MNKNTLLNQNYICPIGADVIHEVWGSEKLPQSKANQILAEAGFSIVGASVAQQARRETMDQVDAQSQHTFQTRAANEDYTFTGDSDYHWQRVSRSEWNETLNLNLVSEDTGFAFSETYQRRVFRDGSSLKIELSDQVWREDQLLAREQILLTTETTTLTPLDPNRNRFQLVQSIDIQSNPTIRIEEDRVETLQPGDSILGESHVVLALGQETVEISSDYQRVPVVGDQYAYGAFQSNPFWQESAEYSRYDVVINGNQQYSLQGIGTTGFENLGHNSAGLDVIKTHVDITLLDQSGNTLKLGADQDITVDADGNIAITAIVNSSGAEIKLYVDPFHNSIPLPPHLKAAVTVASFLVYPITKFFSTPDLWIWAPGVRHTDKCQPEDHYQTAVLNFVHTEVNQTVTQIILTDDLGPDPNMRVIGPRYGSNSMAIRYLNGTDEDKQTTLTMIALDSLGNRVEETATISIPKCP